MATSASTIEASMKAGIAVDLTLEESVTDPKDSTPATKALLPLECVPCIYYPLRFKKDQAKIKALLDFGNEVNGIAPAYAAKLDLKVWLTDVGVQKIDSSTFKTLEMVLASFQVKDKLGRACVFQKTFLLTATSVNVILEMPFLTLNNADIHFAEKELT